MALLLVAFTECKGNWFSFKTRKNSILFRELLLSNKIKQIYLDRGKLRYTGRLKKLCEGARSQGLEF